MFMQLMRVPLMSCRDAARAEQRQERKPTSGSQKRQSQTQNQEVLQKWVQCARCNQWRKVIPDHPLHLQLTIGHDQVSGLAGICWGCHISCDRPVLAMSAQIHALTVLDTKTGSLIGCMWLSLRTGAVHAGGRGDPGPLDVQ